MRALLREPGLWLTALRQARRMVPPGWWRRLPFLPVPSPAYVRFRMQTQYGGAATNRLEADDLITYLRWCRQWQRAALGG